MHFVILAEHSAEVCPTSNAKTRAMLLDMGPKIPSIAEQSGVTLVSGPWVNREHMTVTIAEADRVESVDDFLVQSRLPQWNRVRVIPSQSIEEGMGQLTEMETLF
jgi:hypothetical protein